MQLSGLLARGSCLEPYPRSSSKQVLRHKYHCLNVTPSTSQICFVNLLSKPSSQVSVAAFTQQHEPSVLQQSEWAKETPELQGLEDQLKGTLVTCTSYTPIPIGRRGVRLTGGVGIIVMHFRSASERVRIMPYERQRRQNCRQ